MNVPTYEQVQIELSRRSYAEYIEYVHAGRWLKSTAGIFVANTVQQFIETKTNNAYDVLIVQEPPQHGKSMTITETLPSWYLGKYPTHRVIEASYNDDFAEKFCRKNKDKIKTYGKKVFDIELATDRATEFELSNKVGGMISRGIQGGITGNPANLIIIDDPIKNRLEADSETFRKRLWEEWLNSIKTRLAARAKIIVIMTRWHEDDLVGRIIKTEHAVTVINLPCEAEANDQLGRSVGDPLMPEIGKDKKWLEDFKKGYQTTEGKRSWLALYQCRPTSEDGNLVNRKWWGRYDTLPEMVTTLISVDATFKDNPDNDFVAIEVWGKRDAFIYLIDLLNKRMDFTDTVRAVRAFKTKYPKAFIIIEDKANGSAIISVLRKEIPGIIAVNPEGGKIARVNAVSPYIESGNVLLPSFQSFTDDFINQFSEFPTGAHDDMVDSASQALNRLIFNSAKVKQPEDWQPPKKTIRTYGR